MSDMAGIAGNAVSVYQQALTTVSNNIANVSTEGYSRQDVSLSALPVTKFGTAFLGSGVALDRIKRQYDAFVESNLRNTTSDLAAQGPMVSYANRVVDVLGSANMGLNTALDAFFASARNVSGDPSSTVLRSSFVRDSQAVADRFGQLSAQLDLVQDQTQHEMESNVNQINAITSQLAKVNTQLAKQKSEDSQPPDLLDQRDLLLKQLSQFARINTSFTPNGLVNVSLGTSLNAGVVVDNQKSYLIQTNVNSDAPEKVALVLDPYGKPTALSGISSGSLAGIIAFREQVLGSSRNALDGLAKTFANEVNTIHQQGIDGYGKPGVALFTFDPSATTAAGGMRVTITDPLQVAAGSQFRVTSAETNPSGTQPSITFDELPAPPINGSAPPAQPPQLGPPSIQNALVNNDSPGAAKTFTVSSSLGVANVATIANGMHDVNLLMNNMQAGQQLQVYTRDGRHLLGSSDVADNSLITSNLLTKENGFAQGATLDDSYLKKSGTAVDSNGAAVAYKGMQLFYGAQASAQAKPIFNSNDKIGSYAYLAADLQGDRINALTTPATGAASAIFGDGAFTLNGKALGALAPDPNGPLQASEIANWINKIQSDTGVRATASNEIVVQPSQMRFGMPLFVKASGVWKQVDTTGINSPEGLAKSINSAGVNLKASINASGNLVITNMSDHVGEDIQISATSADNSSVNSLTALGLGATTFRGRINLSKPAMDAITIDASKIDFGKGLVINGQSVWPLPAGSNTPLPPYSPVSNPPIPKDLADAINRKSGDTGVIARIGQDANGGATLVLGSVASSGDAKILITGTPSAAKLANSKDGSTHYEYSAENNALGIPNSTDPAGKSPPPVVSYPANPAGQSPADPIQLGFGTGSDAGTPADLAKLGFRSGAYITGAVKDDLLVFVTGPGSAAISASYAGQPVDGKQNLRAQALKVEFFQDADKFDGKLYYTITSTDPANAALGATTVAERVFDPAQLNPGVRFQGLNLAFTAAPQPGDVFNLDGNQDGLGNNDNMLSLAALETKAVVGNKTLTNSYIDQVNEMGNIARQATISQNALTVVHNQAVSSRDQISGVSLDKEAADLIRYQQAYQASAKVMQMASQLFDTVLHVN